MSRWEVPGSLCCVHKPPTCLLPTMPNHQKTSRRCEGSAWARGPKWKWPSKCRRQVHKVSGQGGRQRGSPRVGKEGVWQWCGVWVCGAGEWGTSKGWWWGLWAGGAVAGGGGMGRVGKGTWGQG